MADSPFELYDASKLGYTVASNRDLVWADRTVNVGSEAVKLNVVRGDSYVPDVKWNTGNFDNFVGGLHPIWGYQEPRVISQTIAPGTKVQPGTTVDLVLAAPKDIPVTVFDNVHQFFTDKTVADVTGGILTNAAVRKTLLQYDSSAAMPAADKAALTAALNSAGITIDDANAKTSLESAVRTLRSNLAFG